MKVITICGSLKFIDEIQVQAEQLELEGNCVLTVIPPTKNKQDYSAEEIKALNRAHLKKIELSDGIVVINKEGYIGQAVKNEIAYAKSKGKEIIYWENPLS